MVRGTPTALTQMNTDCFGGDCFAHTGCNNKDEVRLPIALPANTSNVLGSPRMGP